MHIQPEILFAYGTLKDTQRLRSTLKDVSRWRILGGARVSGRLYDAGPYPVLTASDDAKDEVPGILVKLESGDAALARLDEYEDVNQGLYVRQRMQVRLDDSTTQEAWVYIYRRSVDRFLRIVDW